MLKNSLLSSNARVVMQLSEDGHVRENWSQLHKGRYGEWLALHQVLAGELCYTFICTCLEPLLNCQCCFKFWGCGYSYTWKNILLRLRWHQKSKDKKSKNIKDVGMACQKVCKQGRDDAWKQRSMYWQSPIPTSFSFALCKRVKYSWVYTACSQSLNPVVLLGVKVAEYHLANHFDDFLTKCTWQCIWNARRKMHERIIFHFYTELPHNCRSKCDHVTIFSV